MSDCHICGRFVVPVGETVRGQSCQCHVEMAINESLLPKLKEQIAKLTRRLAEAEALVPRWVACSERMPPPHTAVLVLERGGERALCASYFIWRDKHSTKEHLCWQQDHGECEADSGNYGNGATISARDLDVTHWMPLPAIDSPTNEKAP